jgi:hypothetical protein
MQLASSGVRPETPSLPMDYALVLSAFAISRASLPSSLRLPPIALVKPMK